MTECLFYSLYLFVAEKSNVQPSWKYNSLEPRATPTLHVIRAHHCYKCLILIDVCRLPLQCLRTFFKIVTIGENPYS